MARWDATVGREHVVSQLPRPLGWRHLRRKHMYEVQVPLCGSKMISAWVDSEMLEDLLVSVKKPSRRRYPHCLVYHDYGWMQAGCPVFLNWRQVLSVPLRLC
jgi:hypothetical protein